MLTRRMQTPKLITPTLDPSRGVVELVAVLMRVLRLRYKLGNTQNLDIPLFLDAYKPHRREIGPPILGSKKCFRQLGHKKLWLGGDPSPPAVYIRKVKAHWKDIELSKSRNDLVLLSNGALAVAFSFIALEQRLQLTVVSNEHQIFLAGGEGSPDVFTSFEHALAGIMGERGEETDWEAASTVVAPPGGNVVTGDEIATLWRQLTATCLFMRENVDLFAEGQFEKLTFKPGTQGGSGRGPVDYYNLLVDVLQELQGRLRDRNEKVQIGPYHNFLAKDIMA